MVDGLTLGTPQIALGYVGLWSAVICMDPCITAGFSARAAL